MLVQKNKKSKNFKYMKLDNFKYRGCVNKYCILYTTHKCNRILKSGYYKNTKHCKQLNINMIQNSFFSTEIMYQGNLDINIKQNE